MSADASWAAGYIGLPWVAGAQGPHAFDCMGFFRFVQGKHFGIDVPPIIAPDYDDPAKLTSMFARHEERDHWLLTEQPTHGCAVIIHRPLHIGVWLDVDGGGVLHCARGTGVIFTGDSAWRFSGFGRKEHFTHKALP